MTKRIIFSLLMIGITVAAVTSATVAYFNATSVNNNNTFSMGTVSLGDTQGFPFTFNNLTPGQESVSGVLGINYTGSITSDLFFGVKAQYGDDLKDVLELQIEKMKWDGATWVSDGWVFSDWVPVSTAFYQWSKFADNVLQGEWRGGKIHIRVKTTADNTYQGKSATNTVFIHAVQQGQTAPGTAPYLYTP